MHICKVSYGAKRSGSTEPSPINTHGSTEALYVLQKCSACSRDIETCYILRVYTGNEGTVNSSFGAEDGLQLLQTVVDDRRKKVPAFAKLPELIAN